VNLGRRAIASRPYAATVMGDMKSRKKSTRSFWVELPILILVAVLVAVVVRTFLVQTFYIPSESMERTLLIDDRVLVNKVVYDLRDPKRGEVVVFEPPPAWAAGPGKDDYIKRVIGIGGDRVICCDANERITVNGKALDEKGYVFDGNKPADVPFDVTVPKGRVFVMGDHRAASADSRAHLEFDSGTIPLDRIVGRAFVIFWPLDHTGALSPPDTFEDVPDPQQG
jgi:signal peptidase I